MTPKQKANIVSQVYVGVVCCLMIATFVFLARWQLDSALHVLVGMVLVMRFEQWYSRRQKRQRQSAEPPVA